MKDYEKIVKSIFIFPIISIVLMWVIVGGIFLVFFNKLQNDLILDKEHTLLNSKKHLEKVMVLSLKKDIENIYNSVNIETKEFIKSKVYEALDIINRYLKDNNSSIEKKKKDLITILLSLRWEGGRGYYFVYDRTKKILLVHPLKSIRGKYVGEFKDAKGQILVKLYDKIMGSKEEGYATIYFPTPSNPLKPQKKIVFVKYIPELDWVIGTGEYPKVVEKKLKKAILEDIMKKRYSKNGYFWVIDTNGNLLAHPYLKEKIGKSVLDLRVNGEFIIKKIIKEVNKSPSGTFVKYYWYKPDKSLDRKVAYATLFNKWDWIIGSGFYLSDIYPEIEKLQNNIKIKIKRLFGIVLMILTLFMGIVVAFSFYLSSKTKKLFSEYSENLEEKINKAIKEIREKDEMLIHQSRLAAMGEMLGAISHQWRQPLNALAINIQLLEDMVEDGVSKKEIIEFIERNMKTIEFMSKTIDDFRNFFRKDKERKKFNVKDVILQVVDMLSAQLKNNNIDIKIRGDGFEIEGYESEFKQVILNLINNAKEAIIDRKVINGKIVIEIKDKKVVIRDNAGGIDENIIYKIFDPYFTTKQNGTGIGLYMSKVIIEKNMGGKIRVKNWEFGAEFVLDFTKSNN